MNYYTIYSEVFWTKAGQLSGPKFFDPIGPGLSMALVMSLVVPNPDPLTHDIPNSDELFF